MASGDVRINFSELNIGAHVKSSDKKDVGKISQLIVQGDANLIGGFLLTEHLVGGNVKVVPIQSVASSDTGGIVLSITEEEVNKLPNLMHEQMVRSPGTLTYGVNAGGLVDLSGTGEQWTLMGDGGGQYPSTGASPFMYEAPMGNVETQNISNLPEDAITLSEGTDVVGSDGNKVGHIDEVYADADGRVSGFLVKAGWLFKHDVHIPMSLVAGVTHNHVRLNVNAQEAEKQGAKH